MVNHVILILIVDNKLFKKMLRRFNPPINKQPKNSLNNSSKKSNKILCPKLKEIKDET